MARFLALTYFHPEWLVARWIKRLGAEAAEELCRINNLTPPLCLRNANTLKNTREELLVILEREGVIAEPSVTPEGIVCHSSPALSTLNSLKAGLFQIQDESSMLVAHVRFLLSLVNLSLIPAVHQEEKVLILAH